MSGTGDTREEGGKSRQGLNLTASPSLGPFLSPINLHDLWGKGGSKFHRDLLVEKVKKPFQGLLQNLLCIWTFQEIVRLIQDST